MKRIQFNKNLKVVLLFVILLNVNRNVAQTNGPYINDSKMKFTHEAYINEEKMPPVLDQIGKTKLPIKFGLGAEMYASGNAHGTLYSAGVHLSCGKSIFSIAPCIQKRSSKFSGVKLGYSYLISGDNDRYSEEEIAEMKNDRPEILQLRLLFYVQYLNKTPLSYWASRVETMTHAESQINYNQITLSTIEGAACAELDINIKWLKLRNYMGFSVFYHTDYLSGMYRERLSPALIFGTGIIIPHF